MAGRWRDPAAFRADPAAVEAARPSHRQTIALLAVLILIAGAVAAVSYLVKPDKARAFDLFLGSAYIGSSPDPVAVDLTDGHATVSLRGATDQVGATYRTLQVVPLTGGTLFLNEQTGEFNMADDTGFPIKKDGGVPLSNRSNTLGVAAGQFAYLVQRTASGTGVYLVGQSTVAAATSNRPVKPRALRALPQQVSLDASSVATTGSGDLWVLTGLAQSHGITQLHLPSDSAPGVALRDTSHGTVAGPAAIEAGTNAGGGAVVGVASGNAIRLFGATTRTVPFRTLPGVTSVLAASNAGQRLSYLLRNADGWSLVSVNTDGSELRGPTLLREIDPSAPLAQPAQSEGQLYTMDTGDSGTLYRIAASGAVDAPSGATSYPYVKGTESGGPFADGYVYATGPRVIYNSPAHSEALLLFTDGSHAPAVVAKYNAASVSASGGAEALTKSQAGQQSDNQGGKPNPGQPRPKPQPNQQVNNQADCKNTTQKPLIPTISQAVPGSTSVALGWTYPKLGQNQCFPQTYVVSVKLLSSNAPNPQQGTVTIQGQQSATIGGLFPSSRYEIVVTAYIGGNGTPSPPARITTGPQGPAAPTNVKASADSSGNWTVAFASCGTPQQGCVPSASWSVISKFCSGTGLASPPAAVSVPADATTSTQQPAHVNGGAALLGRGLTFQVQGVGLQGTVGALSKATPCVQSWRAPNAGAMSLSASKPDTVSVGGKTTATLALDLGANPILNAGGVGANVIFKLTGPTGSQTHSTTVSGGQSTISTTIGGIEAGGEYRASAQVSPPGHPGETVTVTDPDPLTTRASWPGSSLSAQCASSSAQYTCDLQVSISGIASSAAHGEKFDFAGTLACGDDASPSAAIAAHGLTLPASFDAGTFAQSDNYYGTCKVSGSVTEASGNPKVFGGTATTPAPDSGVDLGTPSTGATGNGDFSAAWDHTSGGKSQIQLSYTGGNPLVRLLGSNWSVSIKDKDDDDCGGGYSGSATLAETTIPDDPCVTADGSSGAGWTVSISFSMPLSPRQSATVTGIDGGPAPTYNPPPPVCNVSAAGLSATWSPTAANPSVSIAAADTSQIPGCTAWSYTVVGPQTPDCSQNDNTGKPPQVVPLSCADPPADSGWSVQVAYDDANGDSQTYTVSSVGGTPPT